MGRMQEPGGSLLHGYVIIVICSASRNQKDHVKKHALLPISGQNIDSNIFFDYTPLEKSL